MTVMEKAATMAVSEMTLLKFFPSDPMGRAALVNMLAKMANAPQELMWLASTILENYDEWPGPRELRAVFCTRFKPADGVEADITAGRLAAKIEARALEAHQNQKHLAAPSEALALVRAGVKGIQ